jgi:hypothetical protein
VLERDPVFPFASKWLGRALMLSGRVDEAQAIFERPPVDAGLLGYLYARTGRRQEASATRTARSTRWRRRSPSGSGGAPPTGCTGLSWRCCAEILDSTRSGSASVCRSSATSRFARQCAQCEAA